MRRTDCLKCAEQGTEMNYLHFQEEQEFANNRADRFAGFDRGDAGRNNEFDTTSTVIARQTCSYGRLILERCEDIGSTEFALHFEGDGFGSLYFGEDEAQARIIAKWWLAGANA
jgi:hypothetical protein